MEALVSGSLPESERALAEQHIAMCEGCRLELELVRAVGSQEKPPAGSKEDWTIDRIFGSEGAPGGGTASEATSEAAAPPSSSPFPSATPAAPPSTPEPDPPAPLHPA
ncbi:MAG TPA: zf-HC2 domain-containing protein, partial [Candidatus Polarisedimenticolia bacterium]|nr:zf-HC2 domain-containing protein [Candidatus Polarisedimenticolia bacterium]